jgi:PPOX class probable FMN-dependent enzyme
MGTTPRRSRASATGAVEPTPDAFAIRTEEQLGALVGPVAPASVRKETTSLTAEYRAMIAASPFVLVATSGHRGLDLSPRGDPPGFVAVEDARTLLLPERRGNNRVDGLRNLLEDSRVALLFLIPGIGEMLRVSGRATISVDPALLGRFAMCERPPVCVLRVAIERVFFQCARAVLRAELWNPPPQRAPGEVPTAGEMLAALTNGEVGGSAYDAALRARQEATLY